MSKRVFDFTAALLGLIVLSPVLLLVALLIRLDSPGPVFFRQERMGKGFRPFRIYKFRTMGHDAARRGGPITFGADPRVTRVGQMLRRTKIDELPQLLNVLRGEMSLVGPRPEVRPYVERFRDDYAEILQVRPGITDPASLKFRHEAELLGGFERPEEAYVQQILPEKIKLAKAYVGRAAFLVDLGIILRTLLRLFR